MRNLWERWKRIARKIGDFQARVILTLFYFFVVGPFALLLKWRADPLAMKRGTPRGWQPKKEAKDPTLIHASKQF